MKTPKVINEISFEEVNIFPSFNQIDHGQLFTLSLTNNTTEYTHGIHRFPAKFIPQIPRWAINQFGGDGKRILDPFMGSGTTLVEGLLSEGEVIGIDIDPLARLISRVKTRLINIDQLKNLANNLTDIWDSIHLTKTSPPMPDIENFEHWFSKDSWSKLQSLLNSIIMLKCSIEEREFFLVVFSSLLRIVSNADDQSHKTYVSGTRIKNPPEVVSTWWKHFNRAIKGLEELHNKFSSKASITINEKFDACSLGLEPSSIDLIITSPPYLDSVDYMYNFMLEYFWLGPYLGIPDRKTFNIYRKNNIGSRNPQHESSSLPVTLLDKIDLNKIPSWRREAAINYFNCMSKHFVEAAKCMRPGARYILVIGNSTSRDGIFPIHDCLTRLAWESGLEMEKAFAYRVRRHYMKFPRKGNGGIILIDWVIVFKKEKLSLTMPPELPLPWVTLGDKEVAN